MMKAGLIGLCALGYRMAASLMRLDNRAPHVVAGAYTPHSAVDIWPGGKS